jgi:hypothetical protein
LEAVSAKAQKLDEEEKQEMLKRIAIETGKQIDQALAFPRKIKNLEQIIQVYLLWERLQDLSRYPTSAPSQ